jgi:SanA protein
MKSSFIRGRLLWIALCALLLPAALCAAANWWICRAASGRIVTDVDRLPVNAVGLVLGTSKFTGDGISPNPFFDGRLKAAARLFHAGKVRGLLVSGDNGRKSYDEPSWMCDGLIGLGVPADAITLDYAGFRTLDSVVRAKDVFGLTRFTIITDDFHEPRSVFLARSHGLDVVGFPSEPVPWRWSKKARIRELASRVRACLDVYVFHTNPKFFGPRVEIKVAAAP